MQNTEMKVFVYFITRLPRMEGGTSYVGFHGGKVLSPSILQPSYLDSSPLKKKISKIYRPLESSSY